MQESKTLAMMNDIKFKRQTQLEKDLKDSDVDTKFNIKSSGVHKESYVKFMDLEDSEVKKSQVLFERKSSPDKQLDDEEMHRSSKTLPK